MADVVRTIPTGPFGTFLYDPREDRYRFDEQARRLLGDLARPDTTYAEVLDRVPQVARRPYEQWRQNAIRSGTAGRVRVPFRLSDREVVLEIQIQNVGGGVHGIITDVTAAEQQYQEMRNRIMMMDFAEGVARFGIWAHDLRQDRLTASKGAVDLLLPGSEQFEFDPKQAILLVHEEDRACLREAHERALRTGQVQHAEFRRAGDPDGRFITQFLRVLDDAGEPLQVYGMVHDVTLLHQSRALRAKHAELEGVQELRSRFVNAAAHELSQPLTPLRIQVALLRSQVPDKRDVQRGLNIIERNLERVGFILNDLLDAARFQAGHLRVEPRPVPLTEHASQAVETFAGMAAERGVTLDWQPEADPVVLADPIRLQQCLNNVVHNAVKFTAERSTVEVRIYEEDEHAVATVRDQGPGLDREQVARAFEPFERVHKGPVGYGGTGLGLYITKALMHAMGGSVEVESEPGKGCEFQLKLRVRGGRDD